MTTRTTTRVTTRTTTRIRAALLGSALTGLTSVAAAQTSSCTVPASTRSVPGVVFGSLLSLDERPMPQDYSALLLQSIGQAFAAMPPVTLTVYHVTDTMATATAYASARFRVTDIGHVTDVKLIASSTSESVDKALLAAIYAADTGSLIPPFPDGTHGRKTFEVQLYAGTLTLDELKLRDAPGSVILPWATIPIAVWDSAKAIRSRGHGSTQRSDEQVTASGQMLVRYVVDTKGRIVEGTDEQRQTSPMQSVSASPPNLDNFHRSYGVRVFEPATIGGCPVPALVARRGNFTLMQSTTLR
jgi:hypothetical protein